MPDPGRVLVVDDDAGIRDVLVALLEDEGYEVRTANDGREGLAILEHWQPDLILLDLMMPHMDGRAFRAAQRELGRALQVPVVVISAARNADQVRHELGSAACLPKPFQIENVVEVVARVISPRS